MDAVARRVLTRSEEAVLRLAMGGHSNLAIARARCVARRTIANQLAAVYSKLGVAGRRELWVHSFRDYALTFGSVPRPWWFRTENESRANALRLSKREKQVVELASRGWSNKVVAAEIGVSTGSVTKYLARATRKLSIVDSPQRARLDGSMSPK